MGISIFEKKSQQWQQCFRIGQPERTDKKLSWCWQIRATR